MQCFYSIPTLNECCFHRAKLGASDNKVSENLVNSAQILTTVTWQIWRPKFKKVQRKLRVLFFFLLPNFFSYSFLFFRSITLLYLCLNPEREKTFQARKKTAGWRIIYT